MNFAGTSEASGGPEASGTFSAQRCELNAVELNGAFRGGSFNPLCEVMSRNTLCAPPAGPCPPCFLPTRRMARARNKIHLPNPLQGYLAHKKQPPTPRATIGPYS